MNLICKVCGKRVVVADNIVLGQHVRCPFCGGKFSYTTVSSKERGGTEQTEAKRLSRQRGRSLWTEVMISAIVIVAVVCCGLFACCTFERFLRDPEGRQKEIVPPPPPRGHGNREFNERMEELGRCITEGRCKANILNIRVEGSLKLVKTDWQRVANALSWIATVNTFKSMDARVSGRSRFNCAELATSIFKSRVFRELYRCYVAENPEDDAPDFSRLFAEVLRNKDQLCQSDVDGLEDVAEPALRDVLKKLSAAMQKRYAVLEKLQEEIDRAVSVVNDAEVVGNDKNSSLAQIEKAVKEVKACDFGQIENGLARLEISDDCFPEIGMDLSEFVFAFDGENNKDAIPIVVETNSAAVISNRMDGGSAHVNGNVSHIDHK